MCAMGSAAVPHVAVCIATFRRPDGLKALLQSLDKVEFEDVEPRVTLVITDNDPAAPAQAVLGDLSALSRWDVTYRIEPSRGIVSARNACLDAVPETATHVAFVDDDETVSPGWMAAMLSTLATTGAQVAQGPVEPDYAQTPPEWVETLNIFRLGPFKQGETLNFAATNNSMIVAAFLREHRLRFDPAFNHTGGEDEEMFGRLRALGGRIVAAADATVYDSVPPGRMTQRWVTRRHYRMGNTLGRIARLRQKGRGLRVVKGVGALTLGLLRALAGLAGNPARRIGGLAEAARGAGMLAAFLNLRFSEYSLKAVARDRQSGGVL